MSMGMRSAHVFKDEITIFLRLHFLRGGGGGIWTVTKKKKIVAKTYKKKNTISEELVLPFLTQVK